MANNPRSNQRRDREEAVVGMGDHLPTFIEKSFEERMAG